MISYFPNIDYNIYIKYTIYIVGFSSVLYILLIIFRHLLLYYIIKALQKIKSSLPKFKSAKQTMDATDREDDRKRDQENKIFNQQVNEIKNRINKEKSEGTIDVEVQRMEQTSGGTEDIFAGKDSLLEMGQENEVIVGIAKPIGKWTSLVLGKKMSQIASIMKHQQQMDSVKDGYWTAYTKARSASSTEATRGAGRTS
ncbi:MAG: hypothetical protein ACI9CD_000972 [Candidatus Deianiraeaceae bacterium]|jgi:hypothetical protein